MKTIVIPSDFSSESIQVADTVLRTYKEEVTIVFIHLFHVADDIQDLLFSSYRKKEYDLVPDEFRKECNMMKELSGGKLKSYKIEFFYGNRLAPLKNFLEYNKADVIAYSESYGVPKLSKSSLDAVSVIKKAGLPLFDTDTVHESAFSDANHA